MLSTRLLQSASGEKQGHYRMKKDEKYEAVNVELVNDRGNIIKSRLFLCHFTAVYKIKNIRSKNFTKVKTKISWESSLASPRGVCVNKRLTYI